MKYIFTLEVDCTEEEVIGVKEQIADAVGIKSCNVVSVKVKS